MLGKFVAAEDGGLEAAGEAQGNPEGGEGGVQLGGGLVFEQEGGHGEGVATGESIRRRGAAANRKGEGRFGFVLTFFP